jgi:hypothetical protein
MKNELLLVSLARKLRGHYNYFGVIGNLAGLHAVKHQVMEQLHKWLNRRSARRSLTWERLKHYFTFTPFVGTSMLCEASVNQGMVVEMRLSLTTAKASSTEEPCEGKFHAGICAGGCRANRRS